MLYEIGDKVLDEWVITRTIGEGSYGKVVEIERNEFGLSMKSALKIISIPGNNSEIRAVMGEGIDNKSITSYFYGFVEEIIKEIAIMSELKGIPILLPMKIIVLYHIRIISAGIFLSGWNY